MKKVKIVFWLLILGFMGLAFFQNQAYFLARSSLQIDLWFKKYFIPETPNGVYFLAFFLFGLLVAYFYYLPERFRAGKHIKQLNAKITSFEAVAAPSKQAATTPDPLSSVRPEPPPEPEAPGAKNPAPGSEAAIGGLSASEDPNPPERS